VQQDQEDHHPAQPAMQKIDRGPTSSDDPSDRTILDAQDKYWRQTREGEEPEPVRIGAEFRLGQEGREEEGGNEERPGEMAEREGEVCPRRVTGRRKAPSTREDASRDRGDRDRDARDRVDHARGCEERFANRRQRSTASSRFARRLPVCVHDSSVSARLIFMHSEEPLPAADGVSPFSRGEQREVCRNPRQDDECEGTGPCDREDALVPGIGLVRVVDCCERSECQPRFVNAVSERKDLTVPASARLWYAARAPADRHPCLGALLRPVCR
jgi:hypothetical protein